MITPNFYNMMWIILIMFLINSLANIISGCIGLPKNEKYGATDIIAGFITLSLLVYFVLLG